MPLRDNPLVRNWQEIRKRPERKGSGANNKRARTIIFQAETLRTILDKDPCPTQATRNGNRASSLKGFDALFAHGTFLNVQRELRYNGSRDTLICLRKHRLGGSRQLPIKSLSGL